MEGDAGTPYKEGARVQAYLREVTGGDSERSIADRAGLNHSTLHRQLAGEVKPQTIVAVCRAYGAAVVPAFMAAGWIVDADLEVVAGQSALAAASDRELVGEILRRLRRGSAGSDLTEPVDDGLL